MPHGHLRVVFELAECREESVDIFFSATTDRDIEYAKRICRRCEVRADCLAYALETPQLYGIWGGFTADERVVLRRGMREALT